MPDVKLCIEPLSRAESYDTLLVTEEERKTAETFGSERRRAEYLLWRHTVRREAGDDVEIGYSPVGSPEVRNRNIYISVSHSADFVAVIISPRRCAVDIERLSRNFSKISSRYITEAERRLSDDPRLPAAVWCAKETLYKYSGRTGLDFLEDLCVEKIDFDRKIIVGRICKGDSIEMRMLQYGENLVVYIG